MLPLVRTAHDFRRACQEARVDGPLALVPTMGYLHEGHTSLIRAARQAAPTVAVTIFVNPTQFGPSEDLARYPRDLDGDLAKCSAAGASFVFAPSSPEEMYPPGFQTYVEPGPLAQPLCGARRPGHFRGVCTVVAKLFALSRADCAFFGEKDYQQLLVIRRMAQDLNLGTDVIGRPIVREKDGIALSSRNAYLSPEERANAVGLWRALCEVRARFARGEKNVNALEQIAVGMLERHGARVDYAELRDGVELQRRDVADESTRLFLAAFFGKTRLIDNGALGDSG
ncbi:MAG TPA: pantoate--beta-alanine ligase [Myxococcales bacterium]|nr:pantoate--beta-alanine ligase [Myxococcales bacterium]